MGCARIGQKTPPEGWPKERTTKRVAMVARSSKALAYELYATQMMIGVCSQESP